MKFNVLTSIIRNTINKNSTVILTGLGIFGYAVTIPLSIRAYEQCQQSLTKRRQDLGLDPNDKLPAKEVAKICWKPMLLPALTFATSTICVIGAEAKILKKNVALMAACKGTETTLAEFQKQTKDVLGDKKFKEIQEKVAEKQMEQTPVPVDRKTYLDDARELYYDGTYGGYFYATELDIFKAFSETNDDLEWAKNTSLGKDYKEYVPLGDLYYRLHGEPIGIGDDFGYPVQEYRHHKLEYMISGEYKSAPNGKKALVIFYDKADAIK